MIIVLSPAKTLDYEPQTLTKKHTMPDFLDDSQELNYRGIARTLAELEFDGYIAHEFIPTREPIGALRDAVGVCNV